MQNSINLFEDNLIANKKEVSYDEIYNGLMTYEVFSSNYPKNFTFENCLILYLSNADGLSSSFNSDDFPGLRDYCFEKFRFQKGLSDARL